MSLSIESPRRTPRVEPILDDVPESVVDVELELDIRVVSQHRRDLRQQDGARDEVAAGDAHSSSRLVAQFGQQIEFGFDFIESVTDRIHESLAGGRRRHAASGARQEPYVEPRFKTANRLAQCGLGDAEQSGRPCEAAFARHGDEGQKVVEVASDHGEKCPTDD